jgi:DNA-binding protein H-NS
MGKSIPRRPAAGRRPASVPKALPPETNEEPAHLLVLDGLSVADLDAVIRKAASLCESRLAGARKDFVTRVKAEAASLGLELPEEFGGKTARGRGSPKPRRGTVAVKYRDGENTWTGRGRMPRWLTAHEAAGRSKEEFLVNS